MVHIIIYLGKRLTFVHVRDESVPHRRPESLLSLATFKPDIFAPLGPRVFFRQPISPADTMEDGGKDPGGAAAEARASRASEEQSTACSGQKKSKSVGKIKVHVRGPHKETDVQ